jgi:hypothetical protein
MHKLLSKIMRNLEETKHIAKRDGWCSVCYWWFHDLISRLTPFTVYKVMILTMSHVDKTYLQGCTEFQQIFLSAEAMKRWVGKPNNDLSAKSIAEAIANQEECLAIFDGEELVSYGWYTDMPAHARSELYFHFNGAYKYTHKTYTVSDYRGKRLHGIGMAKACEKYTERKYNGLIGVVEAHNLNSIRSAYRLGWRDVGKAYAIMIFGRYLTYEDRGSRRYGCKLRTLEEIRKGQRRKSDGCGA